MTYQRMGDGTAGVVFTSGLCVVQFGLNALSINILIITKVKLKMTEIYMSCATHIHRVVS